MSDAPAFNPERFKAATREAWERAAPGWNAQAPRIRPWLAEATEALLDEAQVRPGAHVLDLAAGAGDQTLDIARRVGPQGRVLATDLSPAILALAAQNCQRAGLNQVETLAVDAEALDAGEAVFDAAVCRLGLMFCPDPLQALKRVHRALKPGARLATLVFGEPAHNPCITILMSTALRHAGQPPRDPYTPGTLLSLGRLGLLDELFRQAGFGNVATTVLAAPFRLPSARDYLDFVRSSATPILQILAPLDDTARQAAWSEIEDKLNAFRTPDGWVGPNELLLTVGQR